MNGLFRKSKIGTHWANLQGGVYTEKRKGMWITYYSSSGLYNMNAINPKATTKQSKAMISRGG